MVGEESFSVCVLAWLLLYCYGKNTQYGVRSSSFFIGLTHVSPLHALFQRHVGEKHEKRHDADPTSRFCWIGANQLLNVLHLREVQVRGRDPRNGNKKPQFCCAGQASVKPSPARNHVKSQAAKERYPYPINFSASVPYCTRLIVALSCSKRAKWWFSSTPLIPLPFHQEGGGGRERDIRDARQVRGGVVWLQHPHSHASYLMMIDVCRSDAGED